MTAKRFPAFLILIIILAGCISPVPAQPTTQQPAAPAASQTALATSTEAPAIMAKITPDPGPHSGKATKTLAATAPTNSKGRNPTLAPASANGEFIASEILGRPTDTSISINVVPAIAMEIYYEYGTASGSYTAQTAAQQAPAGALLETTIDGLQPNTRYYYRIRYNDAAGSEHTFITQRAPGSTFTFDLQGDSHPERVGKEFNADLYTRTLQSAASDLPDFYMTIGDDFSVDTLKTVNSDTVRALYVNQRQWLGLVGAPVFLVNGNHEQASMANLDGTPNNVAVWAQTARNAYFPEPAPDNFYTGDPQQVQSIGRLRDYYAWTWGDALFVVIDPYWHSPVTVDNAFGADRTSKANRNLWDVTLGDTQYQWLKTTLETSTAKYKFVFAHHVLGTGRGGIEEATSYEWGDVAGLAVHRPGWDRTIQQLMADNHVTIFFQGHDHIFVHQELDGVVYQTLPEPADPNYSLFNAESYHTGEKLPNSGHVRVTVAPGGVKVEYVRSYIDKPDEVTYSYTVH